jgi:hypothetical protein
MENRNYLGEVRNASAVGLLGEAIAFVALKINEASAAHGPQMAAASQNLMETPLTIVSAITLGLFVLSTIGSAMLNSRRSR